MATMRRVLLGGVLALAACGRLGFDARNATGGSADAAVDGTAVTQWTHVAAYQNSTCGERAGSVYCWGDNASGQTLGVTGANPTSPARISLPAGAITSLSIGDRSACAVIGGALYCWGAIGSPAPAPARVSLASPATQISVAHDFQCAIAGDAYCWGGANGLGQQGTGDVMPHPTPTAVAHPTTAPNPFVAVETGDDHACVLDSASVAFCFGHNDGGAIGLPTSTGNSTTPVAQDAQVHTLPQIAGWHACALVATGVVCWGDGTGGQLGNGMAANSVTPVAVTGLTAPSAIANGGGPSDYDASCAIDGEQIRCWGNGFYGRLGDGTANSSATPVTVRGLPAARPTEVAIGDDHACAALADGSLWCWGRGDAGQLGDGRGSSSLAPVRVLDP